MKKQTLEQLLDEVSKLFRNKDWKKGKLSTYDFSLNKFPYGWNFTLTNSWHKWHDKGFKTDFGAYERPEYAVEAFLTYVKDFNIKVKKLMD